MTSGTWRRALNTRNSGTKRGRICPATTASDTKREHTVKHYYYTLVNELLNGRRRERTCDGKRLGMSLTTEMSEREWRGHTFQSTKVSIDHGRLTRPKSETRFVGYLPFVV